MEMTSTFKRKERKYLVDKDSAVEIMQKLDEMLYRRKFRKGNEETYIRSTYFDSDDFKCFVEHKNREKARFKIRIRQYGNGVDYYKRCFVEIKEKINGINHKRRFRIKEKWSDSLIANEIDFKKLLDYNRMDMKMLASIYHEIQEKLFNFKMHPVLQVAYHRQAYENSEKNVRITFDDSLSFGIRTTLGKVSEEIYDFTGDKIIMETKSFGTRPYWLSWLLKEYGLKRQRFSKYCTGIETVYAETNSIERILKTKEEEVINHE